MIFPFENSYARLPKAFYASVNPTPVREPGFIRVNFALADELGIDIRRLDSPEGLAILAGNAIAEGSQPLAMAYSGHQFGGFSPQLGDGRAILLGELVGKDGIRRDIQLKGSGPTPFSRRGDGRSALGPVLREYIVSEAMAALGVPSTRALAAVVTGETVIREELVPGGVFTRVAQSHIRVGTFQWFAARQDHENLRVLADHVITRHYPEAREAAEPYLALLEGVIARQARLIAHWMQLGFIHGVMNTDNMTVSGETIDYGPCAFMDDYDSKKRFSSIDQQGRYAFSNQGPIAHWNLTRLAEAMLPLLDDDQDTAVGKAEDALAAFAEIHQHALRGRFANKIGLTGSGGEDWQLVSDLLAAMAEGKADFTLTFRRLAVTLESGDSGAVTSLFQDPGPITQWLAAWRKRITEIDTEIAGERMRRANPVFIPRNHRVEEAIRAGNQGDFKPFNRLVEILRSPFSDQPEASAFEAPPSPEEVVRATFCGT
jgi:uncharacterized protein YdiU (UPF0061 family)